MHSLNIIVYTLFGVLVWHILACIVLAAIDDKRQSLFNWATSSPYRWGFNLVLLLWPIVLIMWYYSKRKQQ